MKFLTPLIFIALLFATACSNNDTAPNNNKDKYEQSKEELAATEKKNPTRFLTVISKDKRNLLGQTVVKGTLNNNAKIASFKDIELKLTFYSKTGVLLEEDVETIFESLAPGKSTDFKTKYFAPKGTDSVAIRVVGGKGE